MTKGNGKDQSGYNSPGQVLTLRKQLTVMGLDNITKAYLTLSYGNIHETTSKICRTRQSYAHIIQSTMAGQEERNISVNQTIKAKLEPFCQSTTNCKAQIRQILPFTVISFMYNEHWLVMEPPYLLEL